ncbi:unnamed protein product, partial [Amoebophrya sp. A120]
GQGSGGDIFSLWHEAWSKINRKTKMIESDKVQALAAAFCDVDKKEEAAQEREGNLVR